MLNIIFLGTPLFSVPCLETILNNPQLNVLGVVTQPDKPSGRGQKLQATAVKAYLQEHRPDIPVWQPKSIRKDAELIAHLKSLSPDFFVTIAFGQILSQEVLDIPTQGTVNVHASLLPQYRGANPIQWAILDNRPETGLTTMLTDIGVDTGAMLLKEIVPIGPDETTLELTIKLSAHAGPLLVKTLLSYANGEISPTPQPHELSTHAPKLKPEAAVLDWQEGALALHNKIRAQQPWPGAYTMLQGERFKITASHWEKDGVHSENHSEEILKDAPPGAILAIMKSGILVQTGDGPLEIRRVQPAGKKDMPARDWANGVLKARPWPVFETPLPVQSSQ